MTLKTSLFNKGIYKSTVRRYLWGGVLYFVILFMCTVLPIILTLNIDDVSTRISKTGYSFLYETGLILPSVLLAMAVPTIVGLLVYRFVHSKKTSIFTHSLPVSRTVVYTSTLFASFTLMAAPVLLNGIILLIMSLTGYSAFITAASCFVWIGMNILAQFLMFACATFVAMLTGNSFAMVGLNILFHSIVAVITVAISEIAKCFLFGFSDASTVINDIVESNFVVWLADTADLIYYNGNFNVEITRMITYIAISVILYLLGWVLYKKRNLETAEDVAGFKILNPIFKYIITFVGAIAAFAVFSSFISYNPIAFWVVVAIISVVIYFAAEMILKKTLKVWNSYKGFIGFSAVFALMIAIFAMTSFFGYETYVPDADEVDSVTVYDYYNGKNEPYIDDKDVIEYVETLHKEFVDSNNIYTVYPEINGQEYHTRMHIKYKLKNGKEIARVYWVSNREKYGIMNDLYVFDEYKNQVEHILSYKPQEIYRMTLYCNRKGESITISDLEEIKELQKSLNNDILHLDYSHIYCENYWGGQLSVEFGYEHNEFGGIISLDYVDYNINRNFKNTIKWFRENGYGDYIDFDFERDLYIMYEPDFTASSEEIIKSAVELTEFVFPKDKIVCIKDGNMKNKIVEYIDNAYISYYPDKEYYYIIQMLDNGGYNTFGILSNDDAQKVAESLFE